MANTDVKARNGFVENEPAIVAAFVAWLFANAGAFVVGHTHLVTNSQWGSLTTGVVPFVTAGVLSVIAFVLRKYVSPAWKVVEGDLGKHGFPTPSTQQVDDLAEQIYEAFAYKHALAQTVAPSEELLASQVPCHAGAVNPE